jgi:hypothetical protein
MCKGKGYEKESKERENMDTAVRYCPVSESLEDSIKQMKSMRDGTLPKMTWDEYLAQLKKEDEKDR